MALIAGGGIAALAIDWVGKFVVRWFPNDEPEEDEL